MVKFNLGLTKRFFAKIRRNSVSKKVAQQWAVRQSAFTKRRFAKEGNGSWKKLSSETLARRRKGGAGAKILRDTGTLLRALDVGGSGNISQPIKHGVRYGFSASSTHPSGKSIADIARYHDEGIGSNPERKILLIPDKPTINGMKKDLENSIAKRA